MGYNMYAYCNNNPVMYVDGTGQFPWAVIGKVALAVVIVAVVAVAVTTLVNHIVNEVNYNKIDEELEKESYTEEEAKAEIEKITAEYGDTCKVTFQENDVMITDSHLVTSRYDRQKICEIISRTGVTKRDCGNMSAEWFGHNIVYDLHFIDSGKREQARTVNIDHLKDPRTKYQTVFNILDFMGME